VTLATGFFDTGWVRFDRDPALVDWVTQVTPAALATRFDPDLERKWLRGNGTWFVGVNALANDGRGRCAGSGPLSGQAIDFMRGDLGFGGDLDRAQVSICYPGFPRRMLGESNKALAFRIKRDGAHVDGLHPVGPDRQRRLRETAGFLIGIPVTRASRRAAPLVIWQGSHRIMAAMFHQMLDGVPAAHWPDINLGAAYKAARLQAFETCKRVVIHANPGEAYVLHRFALHGVAPWQAGAVAAREGRAILYFRPEVGATEWLQRR